MMGEHPSDARLLLALDGELEAREAALVADHVRACPACHATWERLSTLSGDIERYCRTSYVGQPRVFSRSAALALAAAAVLFLLAGGGWLLRPRGNAAATRAADIALAPVAATSTPREAAHTARTTATRASDAARSPRTTPAATHELARSARARATRGTTAATATRRAPTYYWSLPYSNVALPLSEGSVVMTVRLSRDQLRLAGIPVTDPHMTADRHRDQSLVRAKVLVGADGQPRAIAFDQD